MAALPALTHRRKPEPGGPGVNPGVSPGVRVAAELAFARLVADRDVAIVSQFGVGAPLAFSAAATALRFAETPAGGVMRDPVAVHLPAKPLAEWFDAGDRLTLIDARGADTSRLLAATGGRAAFIRQGALAPPPDGYARIFADHCGGEGAGRGGEAAEAIWAAPDVAADAAAALADLQEGDLDLFDALAAHAGWGAFSHLRHVAGGAEVLLDPAALLDRPDRRQVDFALGDGRALADLAERVALIVPRLSAAQGVFALMLRCGDAPSVLDAPIGAEWSVARDDALWRIDLMCDGVAEADRLTIAASPPEGDLSAELVECALSVRRGRAAWELWDEACRRAADDELDPIASFPDPAAAGQTFEDVTGPIEGAMREDAHGAEDQLEPVEAPEAERRRAASDGEGAELDGLGRTPAEDPS